ncbi:chaoptin-like [Amphibalanus amphitrite]|uniref:chaoptin-like n=1 Tax=Amphibalanus amphitrite TaxID=1232801 RepID=UPI001C92517A|nr:chaoptin-like [Amphibalanus amphitrite]
MQDTDRLLVVSASLTLISLLLLLWAGSTGAADPAAAVTSPPPPPPPAVPSSDRRRSLLSPRRRYPPCQFNPQCSCSNSGPDLGLVECDGVRMVHVPTAINTTKVFSLTLRDNGLGEIDEDRFFMARLWRLAVQDNELRSVPGRAFSGLERSLWQLDLSGNRLTRVPHQAVRSLSNLRLLDLSHNRISTVRRSDLQGLESHLETLVLAGNFLRQLPADLVNGLGVLQELDLSTNVLTTLPAGCLSGAPRLTEVNLAGNLLTELPYAALKGTPVTTVLLGGNLINDTRSVASQEGGDGPQLQLQVLDLSENRISYLPESAWSDFAQLDSLTLRGNQLEEVDEAAFESAPAIRELYMYDCSLRALENNTLVPLAGSLRVLDLGYNQLTEFPWHTLPEGLETLALNDNRLAHISAEELNRLGNLQKLNLLGESMGELNVSALTLDLRNVGLSALPSRRLTAEQTDGVGESVRKLYLGQNRLEAIDADAFSGCPILKHLDLSHNRIGELNAAAFEKLGPSLESLIVFDGYSANEFPADQLQYLTSLKTLDFSGNRIATLPAESFSTMRDLRHLVLEHNRVTQLDTELFNADNTPSLHTVHLDFNQVSGVGAGTFRHLEALQEVRLADNAVSSLSEGAFSDLAQLRAVSLDGNRLTELPDSTFSGLPRASRISLAHNQLTALNLDAFDQVGTLASLQLDASHNQIVALDMEREYWHSFTSFEYLDLSHNRIGYMTGKFFETMRSSLTHASLAHNNITNITRDVFGFMPYIQLLDLSDNAIDYIDYDSLRSAVNLQTLNVSRNNLTELPAELVQNLVSFRVLDVSHNHLTELPANLFRRTALQILRASHNNLTTFPGDCLSRVGDTLCELDLSHNRIAILTDDLLHRLGHLARLDLSHNRILSVEAGALRGVRSLRRLDLSGNPLGDLSAAAALRDLPELRRLRLANASLTRFPTVSAYTLEEMDVSENAIISLRAEAFSNLTSLRRLDLAANRLTVVDRSVWSMLSDLRILSLSGNPFSNVSQLSLEGLEQLTELDLSDIDTSEMQPDLLTPLESLTHLTISINDITSSPISSDGDDDSGLPALLRRRPSLRHLHVRLNGTLTSELDGELGHHLCNITISGPAADGIAAGALKRVTCHHLHLVLGDVPRQFRLPAAVFQSLDPAVRYVSVRTDGPVALGRPFTSEHPGRAGSVFLTDLSLDGDGWSCDCSETGIGWVEQWLSVWRHNYCPQGDDDDFQCQDTIRRLRRARCSSGKSVLAALSSDVECHSNGAATISAAALLLTAALTLLAASATY